MVSEDTRHALEAVQAAPLALPPSTRAVLMAIAIHTRPTGWAYVSRAELAATAGVHKRTAKKAVDRLVSFGVLDRIRNPSRRCSYRIRFKPRA